ncbi:hypothetical protein ACLB1Q_26640 [Escherichia coli]
MKRLINRRSCWGWIIASPLLLKMAAQGTAGRFVFSPRPMTDRPGLQFGF